MFLNLLNIILNLIQIFLINKIEFLQIFLAQLQISHKCITIVSFKIPNDRSPYLCFGRCCFSNNLRRDEYFQVFLYSLSIDIFISIFLLCGEYFILFISLYPIELILFILLSKWGWNPAPANLLRVALAGKQTGMQFYFSSSKNFFSVNEIHDESISPERGPGEPPEKNLRTLGHVSNHEIDLEQQLENSKKLSNGK
jgi:hypothetical protein